MLLLVQTLSVKWIGVKSGARNLILTVEVTTDGSFLMLQTKFMTEGHIISGLLCDR